MNTTTFLMAFTTFLSLSFTAAAEPAPPEMTPQALQAFDKEVRPVLKTHCYQCHGPDKQKGNLRIDTLSPDLFDSRAAETWHDVLDAINLGEMPAEDELTPTELDAVVGWLTRELKASIVARKKSGGNIVRRLTKYEYQNTMRDLLGPDFDYASELPPDSLSEDGFQNNGATMQMSALQMEYYLKTAHTVLDRIIVTGPQPKTHHCTATKPDPRNQVRRRVPADSSLNPSETFGMLLEEYPKSGPYRLRITVDPHMVKGHGAPRMRIKMGYRAGSQLMQKFVTEDFDVTESGTYEFTGFLDEFPMLTVAGKFPGFAISITNYYDDGTLTKLLPKRLKLPKAKKGEAPPPPVAESPDDYEFPQLIIRSVEFTAPVYASWPPPLYRRILFESDLRQTDEAAYAKAVVMRFASRAYRRPVSADQVAWLMQYYTTVRPSYDTFEGAIKEVLAMVLTSPEFIYRMEPLAPGKHGQKTPVTDYELATRLSYLLWSTMPDDALLTLAAQSKLRSPQILKQQLARMIKDPKIGQFIDHYSSQWFDLNGVDRIAINPQYYPDFDDSLKVDMQQETKHYFGEVLLSDLSAITFLDSDFMVVNNRLARHYGTNNNLSGDFRRVSVSDKRRGGVLSQGSMLLSQSTGEDSHPIKRAVWVLERILHDPPPPPPPDVAPLDPENPDFAKLPMKKQLELHRNIPACVRCHKQIDPWGIAFEGFGATGLPRDIVKRLVPRPKGKPHVLRLPVETNATLPSGHKIDGIVDLKQYLVTHEKDKFAKAFVHKLLTYSLGRSLDLTDDELIDELTTAFKKSDYRIQTLLEAIILSDAFLTK